MEKTRTINHGLPKGSPTVDSCTAPTQTGVPVGSCRCVPVITLPVIYKVSRGGVRSAGGQHKFRQRLRGAEWVPKRRSPRRLVHALPRTLRQTDRYEIQALQVLLARQLYGRSCLQMDIVCRAASIPVIDRSGRFRVASIPVPDTVVTSVRPRYQYPPLQ